MLPIGVVIPTRNCIALLPGHLQAMQPWLGHAAEVLVVDSESRDGTLDMLRTGLRHPNLRFLSHPPGLYQSWNYGIGQIQSEFCYVSTVGESITLEGLQHLTWVAQEHRCDAVVSRPDFLDEQGRPMPAPAWPIQDILRTLAATSPVVLEGPMLFLFTLLHYRNAILGSSASNLYRTACLRERPFPLDYGTVGDGAWGLRNCLRVRLAVSPRVFSTFREHPKSYSKAEYTVDRLGKKMLDEIRCTFRQELVEHPEFSRAAQQLKATRILELLEAQRHCQERLEQCREAGLPWILNPVAWAARRRRSRIQDELDTLKTEALSVLSQTAAPVSA